MSRIRQFGLWMLTFVAFPLSGLIAIGILGSVTTPLRALAAGALAGAILGTAQWLVLRMRGVSWVWVALTIVGIAIGSAISNAVTDAGTSTGALVVTGAITGAVLGAAQGLALRRGVLVIGAWMVVVSIAWAIGWLATASVIVDADKGFITFGASGAILATAITGLVLMWLRPTAGPEAIKGDGIRECRGAEPRGVEEPDSSMGSTPSSSPVLSSTPMQWV